MKSFIDEYDYVAVRAFFMDKIEHLPAHYEMDAMTFHNLIGTVRLWIKQCDTLSEKLSIRDFSNNALARASASNLIKVKAHMEQTNYFK